MSLREQLEKELDRLVGATASAPQTVEIDIGSHYVTCLVASSGSVGCAISELSVRSSALADATMDQLNETANRLASKLTYLLEPIAVIETDPDGGAVQLRSDPPHQEENERTYYELVVRNRGELSLCRYRAEARQLRERVDAQFTREVLLRLVGDFVAIMSP